MTRNGLSTAMLAVLDLEQETADSGREGRGAQRSPAALKT